MNPNPEKRNDWLAQRVPGAVPANPDYPEIERANKCLSYWMAGYDELEISTLLELGEIEVARDLAYLKTQMSTRQLIAISNDRQRILIQKKEADNYSSILNGALTKSVDHWLAAGLSPVPAMKEYRQAVGLEEKPGGVAINLTKQSATFFNAPGQTPVQNLGGHGKVTCFEDLVRMIIKHDPSCGLQPAIDIDAQDGSIDAEAVLPVEDFSDDEPGAPADANNENEGDNPLQD